MIGRFKNYINRVRLYYRDYKRKIYLKPQRNRLKNTNFSLIASDCNGATILHDLGLKFNSPFVNLWIYPKDYLKMLKNLKEYLDKEIVFVTEDGIDYPVGMLGDVKIYFQHYYSKDDALDSWNKRKARINYDNLFILFTDRNNCQYEDLLEFDALPFENKKVFVNREYPEIKSAVYIKGFEKEESVGFCMDYRRGYEKYYDEFDYVGWFNKELR